MREADRHQDLVPLVRHQLDLDVLAEGRGAATQVDVDVEDASPRDTDQFRLAVGRKLVMEAANRAGAGRPAVVLVNQLEIEAGLLEEEPVVRGQDEAPRIRLRLGAKHLEVGNGERADLEALDDNAIAHRSSWG